ncbi:serine/threonine-protein kinase 11-interacting protein [Aplochiton taeniatus]
MAASQTGHSTLVPSLAALLRNDGDSVLDGTSTLTLEVGSLQQLTRLFERYLLSRTQQHGFLALPSHPADTTSLLQLQFLFDVLQKTVSLKLVQPPGSKVQSVVKIFPFKSLQSLELKRVPPHCLEGLRGVYSQLEVFTCSRSLSTLEELLSLCGGDLSSALPWLELHTLNFSYNTISCLDHSLSLLNVLKSLDLSHNLIQDCGDFLMSLSELQHCNLGYNRLQKVPSLSLSSRTKLLSLVLRNNQLDTINGLEQLCSLQHLDLSLNLLLEHSQLAPLVLLHELHTLNLEGNPLFYQNSHRTSTVPHLSPRATSLHRLKLNGCPLSSSELSSLPKPGQLIGQAQAAPPVAVAPERNNQEVSSGGGELSDSLTAGPVIATPARRKKARGKVKVRRASISEPSTDTDHQPRPQTCSSSSIAVTLLPHQGAIERMDSFRQQLGEDWLKYQHHLEGPLPSPNPASLDILLCLPLLVGVLREEEEEKEEEAVFLRVKQAVLLELDAIRGRERTRLELDALTRVIAMETPWETGEESKTLPVVELTFSYVSRDKRRRRYVLLDQDPQEALQALMEVLRHVVEENQRRTSEDRRSGTCLQCLRCQSEFSVQEEEEEPEEEGGSGSSRVCPQCGSDHVVQLAGQSALSTSTPLRHTTNENEDEDDDDAPPFDLTDDLSDSLQGGHHGNREPGQAGASSTAHSSSSSFFSAQEGSLCLGDGEAGDGAPLSFFSSLEDQSPGEVSGSQPHPGASPPPTSAHAAAPAGEVGAVMDVCATPPDPVQPLGLPEKQLSCSEGQLNLLSEDFEVVDHRLKLFLDMEVFEEEEEELHSFLKMSVVKLGELAESPSLLVVSNQRFYFLEMTSSLSHSQPSDWLQKRYSHPIRELSSLEVGLGSQTVHMEFEEGGVAYTLVVRDSVRCKRFFSLLTGIVREMASKSDSKLKSISTSRLHPQHHLWPLVCEDIQTDVEDGQLQFHYQLACLLHEDTLTPVTILATRETLYLLNEDHQWSKNVPNPLANGSADPCSGRVTVLEMQPISCVSSVRLWSSDPCRLDIQLYDEVVKQEKLWSVRSECSLLVQDLLLWLRTQWENMFGVRLTTSLTD